MQVTSFDPSTLNPAATSVVTSNDAGAADRFLKLLVAQMQNQDPLSPMDNAQVTSQMAQIQTVNGIEKLDRTVASLGTQFSSLQATQAAGLVGHDVTVAGDRLAIGDGLGVGGFELDGPADAVKLEILSAAGVVVDAIDLGAQSSGLHGFEWPAAGVAADAGLRFRISATRGAAAVTTAPLMRDRVQAVSADAGALSVQLERNGTLAWTDIRAFN